MNKSSIYTQVALNALPVVGYWFWGWSMFAIIYLYWAEALLMSIFVFLKILIAKGAEPGTGLVPSPLRRFFSGFKVMLVRVALLMFYWIFIFLFVGMGAGKYSNEETMENLRILVFMHPGFNLALLAFFLSQIIDFIRDYILSDVYKTSPPSRYKQFFDERTIVIHVVVVLGTFAYQYLEKYASVDNRVPGLGFVLIMFFVKSIADVVVYIIGNRKMVVLD